MAKIINIEDYSDTLSNYTMIDGLTPDIIKRKYIWLLNALVENAIIGEDDYGLVWYSGNWLGGEWEDGTWYSGIWYDGEWKNGNFYSYRFDTRQLLQRNKRILEKDNPAYSEFKNGIWRRGNFYNGYFGPDRYFENWEFKTDQEIVYYPIRWESGVFQGGIFRNASWLSGTFQGGIFYNSLWYNGTFSNGTFQGYEWRTGNFTGGDFVLGYWRTGNFNQSNINIKSRFGSMPLTGKTNRVGTSVIWYDGQFINGEFHSGLNIVSGVTTVSDNHNRTIWKNGTWVNGSWYGGTHVTGDFNNGYWFEGYWENGVFNNGFWWNGFWLDGIINDGFFIQGVFINVIFNSGQLGYQPNDAIILGITSNLATPPKFLKNAPTVTTDNVTGLTFYSFTSGGEVLDDGGESITAKGICWSQKAYPSISDEHTMDGNGDGGFVSYVSGLLEGTYYNVRAYATNAVGTTYGQQITFRTLWAPTTTTTTLPVTTTTTT